MATSLDDLVSMAMFARVVEAKSFTAAATTLAVSKSLVSRRIAALEERLGARLLHRTTRRLALTPEGARLYGRCLEMLRAADEGPELVQDQGDEPRGVLRVNCPEIFSDVFLSDAIADFVKRYPRVAVEMSVSNTVVDLISERVDLAIRFSVRLASSSLVARRLATAPKVLCASPDYLQQRGTPRTPDDLRGHACLRFLPLPMEAEWKFRDGESDVVVPVSGPIGTDNAEALRLAALASVGVINLPLFFVAADLAAGRLIQLLDGYPILPVGIFAVYSKGKIVPTKVRKFVDHLVARLRTTPLAGLKAS